MLLLLVAFQCRSFVGEREKRYSDKGQLTSAEVRGRGDYHPVPSLSLIEGEILRGDYYMFGKKVSRIRNGCGLRILRFGDETPMLMASYQDGRPYGPFVTFFTNGVVRSFGVYDTNGVQLYYETRGAKEQVQ